MTGHEMSDVEKAKASREARQTEPTHTNAELADRAIRRYLLAEKYRDERPKNATRSDDT